MVPIRKTSSLYHERSLSECERSPTTVDSHYPSTKIISAKRAAGDIKSSYPRGILTLCDTTVSEASSQRLHICFNESVTVRSIAPLSELARQPRDLWYQNDEYDKISRKCRKIIKLVQDRHSDLPAGKFYCIRGLEKHINNAKRSIRARTARIAVLLEQREQDLEGNYNDEIIAEIYIAASLDCAREAIARARMDEQENTHQ